MSSLMTLRHKATVIMVLFLGPVFLAQESYKESFDVGKDVLVEVNTSHTNVIFETWAKNKVEVEAYVDDKSLSASEKKKIMDGWDLDVLGNSKKVVVTSNEGSLWGGIESMGNLKSLERLNNMPSMNLEMLKGLEGLEALKGLGDINWNFTVPETPELEQFPVWPFSDERPNFKEGSEYNYYYDGNKRSHTFDRGEYEKNKQKYVDKLNNKYNSNVSVRQVDSWLEEVDKWSANIEETMEEWGENFGREFEQKFGPEFEKKMEKWGEEFGKSMEKWGEEFGEQFGKEMEKWGEEFGKDMEKWAEQFEKNADKWAEEMERKGHNYSKQVQTDEHGNKSVIIQGGGKGGLFSGEPVKAKKTIIIRMPKGTRTDINVRHGEVKMADAQNIKASLKYSKLTANSIDGGETLINVAYAPVYVNNWKNGLLDVKYVDDCKLNKVDRINLQANSSNVNILTVSKEAFLSGSFGNLFINEIANDFETVDITLENTDANVNMPSSNFNFYYNGKKSRFIMPASLKITTNNKSDSRSLVKGYHGSNGSNRSVTINASYSNIEFNN
ncbi:MAG: hypothetical protein HKO54_03030 [Flavobacteriaceae bacterium]|nr:hypothetical protein [Flavobacteriaceae bacterium]